MTEAWKSLGRKFCDICKVWFGDNKASIEHHERGAKHKAAVQQKLRDLGKSNQEKAKKEANLQAMLAQMEQGAHASMAKNDEGVMQGPALPERGLAVGPRVPVGGSKYLDPRQMNMASMAVEMDRRKKEEEERKKEAAAKLATKSSLWREDDSSAEQPLPGSDPSEILWVEADAEDGSKYYYHMYSGATAWEAPDRFFTQKEYDRRLADIEKAALERQKMGLPADPSQTTMLNQRGEEITIAPPVQVAKRKQPRAEDEIEREVKKTAWMPDPAAIVPGYGSGPAMMPPPAPMPPQPRFTAMPERSGPPIFGSRKERRRDLDSKGRVKQEPAAASVFDPAAIPMPDEIPLPPSSPPPAAASSSSSVGTTSFSESTGNYTTGPAAYAGGDAEAVPSSSEEETPAAPVGAAEPFKQEVKEEFQPETEEDEGNVDEEVRKMASKATPFGTWTKVKHDPNAKPYVASTNDDQKKAEEKARAWREKEGVKAAKAPPPKIEFTEKVAPVLTKKKNAGPVEFKKKSAPKSVRRREED